MTFRSGADEDYASIAVLQLGKLGDMILTTPLYSSLRMAYPGARITAITTTMAAPIARELPSLDAVISIYPGFLKIPSLARNLVPRRFDLYIDPKDHHSTTSRVTAELVNARRSIVHSANQPRRGDPRPLPAARSPGHFVDVMLAPLQLLSPATVFDRRPSIAIPPEVMARIDGRLGRQDRGRSMVTVNISAGNPSRYWLPEKWKTLVREIAKSSDVAIISSLEDRGLAGEISLQEKAARPIVTETILEAAAVIARSRAVVTPETSIVHAASALNCPTLALYGSIDWNVKRFAPLADRHAALLAEADQTVADIPVERVIDAFRKLIADVT